MVNPYEAPLESESETPIPEAAGEDAVPVRFTGGIMAIIAIGFVGGLLIMAAAMSSTFINPFFLWGLIGFASLFASVSLLQGAVISVGWKFGLPLLLTPVVFVLFVPVCTVSGFAAMATLGSAGYGPSEVGMSLAVIISFTVAVGIVAAVIRSHYASKARYAAQKQRRAQGDELGDFSTTRETIL